MAKEEKDIRIRRRAMAEDVLRFQGHYPLAKLLAFYCWATEEDGRGRMRFEREKTWSTGRRLVLFTTKAPLPEGWRELFPEFAKACGGELEFKTTADLTPSPSPMGEGGYRANGRMGDRHPGKPSGYAQDTPEAPHAKGALPDGHWRLLSIDKKTLWDAMQAARKEVSELEYKHWIEPAATADIVEKDTLVITYYGHTFRGQNPMQAPAFIALLKQLREKFKGRIQNARAEWR